MKAVIIKAGEYLFFRDIYISTTGKAIKKFNPYIDSMLDDLVDPLANDEYYDAMGVQ